MSIRPPVWVRIIKVMDRVNFAKDYEVEIAVERNQGTESLTAGLYIDRIDWTRQSTMGRALLMGMIVGLAEGLLTLCSLAESRGETDSVGHKVLKSQMSGKLVYYMQDMFTWYESDATYWFLDSVASRLGDCDYVSIRWLGMLEKTKYRGRNYSPPPGDEMRRKRAGDDYMLNADMKANVLI